MCILQSVSNKAVCLWAYLFPCTNPTDFGRSRQMTHTSLSSMKVGLCNDHFCVDSVRSLKKPKKTSAERPVNDRLPRDLTCLCLKESSWVFPLSPRGKQLLLKDSLSVPQDFEKRFYSVVSTDVAAGLNSAEDESPRKSSKLNSVSDSERDDPSSHSSSSPVQDAKYEKRGYTQLEHFCADASKSFRRVTKPFSIFRCPANHR